MREIYLDNSATTKPLNEVVKAMMEYYEVKYGNPSSMHRMGVEAERGLKFARKEIAKFLKAEEKEIIFTSGGTESNNMAILGTVNHNTKKGNHIITTTIEHPSVLNVFKNLEKKGFEVSYLSVNHQGKINLEELQSLIRKDTILISIMMVNNEIGTIQPIKEIGKIIKEKNNECIFHVDGVQAFGKIYCYPKSMNIDLFTMSGHKIHGPKGIGALYKRKDLQIDPIFLGGGQESTLRSGTENVPGIVGMGKAVEKLNQNFEEKIKFLRNLREKAKEKILREIENVSINGPTYLEETAPHILSISFENIKGEVLLHSLEQEGIYVSTGSACSSKEKGSHVLKNIGLSDKFIDGTLRISFSILNTEEEIDFLVEELKRYVKLLRKIIRR
ncbi:cysteine desulfurase family protein [Garciella nitratireducens]|uniref:cysteine desulfurase family protein n=1 Tax=Garciella nitratireducens TaxID=218205 RepID=UPI000DE9FAB1|nr:cysteine desulfurase family protein [Garciella nitratireducens]RBP46631.1 cysteine desulfurase [Garciella nitratireducens]